MGTSLIVAKLYKQFNNVCLMSENCRSPQITIEPLELF